MYNENNVYFKFISIIIKLEKVVLEQILNHGSILYRN